MGKRSMKTTKSGKYINPTDQARKEQRRRELKKNKKQREVVRSAVIKSKDPKQIIAELELLDEQEFNPVQDVPLSARVIQEKRRKLKETLQKVEEVMVKENPECVGEFRQMLAHYEKRRAQKQAYLEDVKNAERVRPDQIPLPSEMQAAVPNDSSRFSGVPAHGILKKTPTLVSEFGSSRIIFRAIKSIPAPPPVPPPELSDSDDESSDSSNSDSSRSVDSNSPSDNSDHSDFEHESPKPRKSLRFAEDFIAEKDTRLTVGRERQRNKGQAEEDEAPYDPEQPVETTEPQKAQTLPPAMPMFPQTAFPPPPLPPMMAQRLPPPPYGGIPGYGDMQAQQQPRQVRRLPGGKLVLAGGPPATQGTAATGAVGAQQSQQGYQGSSHAYQMAPAPADPKVTTIEKKAQLKNLLQESTKFIPPQLQVRREYKDAHGRLVKPTAASTSSSTSRPSAMTSGSNQRAPGSYGLSAGGTLSSSAVSAAKGADKDDSYAQFMKSLDGLL